MEEELAEQTLRRHPLPQPVANPAVQAWLGATRPLSDIRETTESSLGASLHGSLQRKPPLPPPPPPPPLDPPKPRVLQYPRPESRHGRTATRRVDLHPQPKSPLRTPARDDHAADDHSSQHSIHPDHVPPRSSSQPTRPRPLLPDPPRASDQYRRILNHHHSESPVKDVVGRLDPRHAERAQRVPSRTIVKGVSNTSDDILEYPHHQHPRIKVDIQLAAPLFVGGSSVEGTVRIVVDEADRVRHRKALAIERVSIDLLGFEEVNGPKRYVFLALGNELVDHGHPPPPDMVQSQHGVATKPHQMSWILVPSASSLPFLITLPLEVGPPPFQSRHARIRYILCATLTIRDAGRQLAVRKTQETAILSVYDPEKALVSLKSPLTASDEWIRHRPVTTKTVTATAGLHRQVWVSGTAIFADVHITNASAKVIKKLEMHLERIVLCYRHAAAATVEMSASQARLFDHMERTIVSKHTIKAGRMGWNRVEPGSSDTRTCSLEIPRGHATVKCNKYFEVRYYLNVVIGSAHHRLVTVQLPIILIHMNSLDVPTNSVAQVAAAIEEKRAGRHRVADRHGSPRAHSQQSVKSIQGRAFAVPRFRSLERREAQRENLEVLGRVLDASPRKRPLRHKSSTDNISFTFKTPPSNRKGRVIDAAAADELRRHFGPLPSPESSPLKPTHRAASALGVRDENRAPLRFGSMLSLRHAGKLSSGKLSLDKLSSGKLSLDKLSLDLQRPRVALERWKPSWI